MDVRCEKCQTEYELDEARLKPGGVTVKCTNCGHMFKIRKRAITNVGAPPAGEQRTRPVSSKPPFNDATLRADTAMGEDPDGPTTVERQWLIRLENGETRSCRELATLQQWIVGGIVTPESLISRTGKTWKRLGDIGELMQYFAVADEARTTRAAQPQSKVMPSTMLGLGKSSAAGGTILPDDDGEAKTTGNFKARGSTTPPPAPKPRTPAMGVSTKPPPTPAKTAAYTAPPPPRATPAASVNPVNPLAETAAAPATPPRRPITQPPPPPAKKLAVPGGNRSTAAWATEGETPHVEATGKPFGGKLAAIPNEPAFASSKLGKVRTDPADESAFSTGKVKTVDEDDDMMPARRGSRAGAWLLVMALLVMGGAGGVIYMFVIRKHKTEEVGKPAVVDAALVAVVTDAAPPVITPLVDAAVTNPLEPARAELTTDVESRIRAAMTQLEGKDDPAAQALRARLAAQLAQDLQDRAGLLGDKAEAEKLRKEAKTIAIDALTLAQHAYKAKSDSAGANLAMAEVLRLQGKSARDIKRYLDAARADKDLAHDVALADALLLVRDGKLDDAKVALAKLDGEVGAADVRPRFHLALIALALGKSADAKTLVDGIAAANPEHAGAHALGVKLETQVVKSDPLPPEEHKDAGVGVGVGPGSAKVTPEIPVVNNGGGGGGSYDSLLAQAEKVADTNCTRALELYGKALEQKPNGVEALTGMGYCHIESKQFSSAHSNFRSALSVSARYEPALYGIAEAYQQQGLKDQAIKAYKEYLDVYPNAAKAQKQLDRLGAGAGDGNGSAPTPPTPPTPTPTPTPTPPPTPTGDGSGSS